MTTLYTYDDPRITYDELCFFYDGGYDLICLKDHAISRVYGRSNAPGKRREDREEIFNLFLRSALVEVNGEKFDDPLDEKVYRFTDEPDLTEIKVTDFGIVIDMTRPLFNTDYIGIRRDIPSKVEAVLDNEENTTPKEKTVVVEIPSESENETVNISVSLIEVKE